MHVCKRGDHHLRLKHIYPSHRSLRSTDHRTLSILGQRNGRSPRRTSAWAVTTAQRLWVMSKAFADVAEEAFASGFFVFFFFPVDGEDDLPGWIDIDVDLALRKPFGVITSSTIDSLHHLSLNLDTVQPTNSNLSIRHGYPAVYPERIILLGQNVEMSVEEFTYPTHQGHVLHLAVTIKQKARNCLGGISLRCSK